MTEDLVDRLMQRIATRNRLDAAELDVMRGLAVEVRRFEARSTMVRDRQPLTQSMLLLSGFVCRYKDLVDGQRQIIEIHVPGDFIDIQGFLLGYLEHSMASLSTVEVALVPHARLTALTERQPHLTRSLWFETLVEAAVHRQWIVSNSRGSAMARIAHLMCELHERLRLVGLSEPDGYDLPLTQLDIGDATGLTPIHVNRMLRALRESGVLTFREGRVTIGDLARLRRVGQFDPYYLYPDRRVP